jgi:hypothetical protein
MPGDNMKDVGSTSFGLVIAYLLPGLMALYALSYFSAPVHALFTTFLKAESNVGLFLLVTLGALAVGLQVSLVRSLIFQSWLCKGWRLSASDFAFLASEGKLSAFRATVDEHYRYHQFWGGMAVVMPILFGRWIFSLPIRSAECWILVVIFLLLEWATVWGAREAYVGYVERAQQILKEVKNA